MKLLVTGGKQRDSAVWKEEWHHYCEAVLVEVDWETNEVSKLLNYESPEQYCAGKDANFVFKAGSISNGDLYLCTQTELLIYEYPSLNLKAHISHPAFNDIHHVKRIGDKIYVVSTGLDMVIVLDERGEIIEQKNVLFKDPWERFDKDTDYRKLITTKPHLSHPNFVFDDGDEVWVSRFEQMDAVCLSDQAKKYDIGYERIHDGIVYEDCVYFTTVNGTVCVFDKVTREKRDIFDLNKAYSENKPLGWCRGLWIENDSLFVGFSAIRSTKFRENLAWMKRGFQKSVAETRALPTRVVEYDMKSRRILKELVVSDSDVDAIFSILK